MTRRELDYLLRLAEQHGLVYIHAKNGKPRAVVIPIGGWWWDKLPPAPDPEGPEGEHWNHTHFPFDENELSGVPEE